MGWVVSLTGYDLSQPPTTNLALWSEGFNSSAIWIPANTTITANTTVSPDGNASADTYARTASGASSIAQSIVIPNGTVGQHFTFSVYIKKGTLTGNVTLVVQDSLGVSVGSLAITPTTSWVRYSVSVLCAAGAAATMNISIAPTTVPGSAGQTIFVWGAQLERGVSAGTYVQTQTKAVTLLPGISTVTYAMGAGVAFTDAPYAPSGLLSWKAANQKVDTAAAGGVTLSADNGEMVLENLPDDISQAGPLDFMADWAWTNQRADLYWLPGTLWANRVLMDSAHIAQPVATIVANGTPASTMVFPLSDPRATLNAPLQTTKYLGDNSGGLGVEGEADILGVPKPVLYGVVSNIPGVRVNAALLIYQVADVSAAILCVRDGGLALAAGTIRATLALLQATPPVPGTYDIYAGVEGTFIKLGTTPVFSIGIDAQEGTPSSNRSHAQIWSRFRQARCATPSGSIDAATVTAADALDANEVGFWWNFEATQLDAMNEILTSFSGYEVEGFDYVWRFYKLVRPSGTTSLDFVLLQPTSQMTTKSRAIRSLTLVRPGFSPNGVPPYLVNVMWGRNYQRMSIADFAGATPPRLIDKFKLDYRTAPAMNPLIWDPSSQSGPWPNAPTLTVNTNYQPGTDGLTCPQAIAEAKRLLALYTADSNQFQLDFTPAPGDQVPTGAVCSITYPQISLGGSPLFRVLQSFLTISVTDMVPRMSLVLGFQT